MKRMLAFVFITAIFAASCSGGASNSSSPDSTSSAKMAADSMLEKNKATALAAVQAFASGNIDEAFKDVTQDAVDYGDGTGAPIKGLDSIKAGAKMFVTSFANIKVENPLVIGDGNHVAVFGDWSGTFKNPMMGIKPTGKSYKVRDADLFTFNDAGKITEHWSTQEVQTIMGQVMGK
ncbi:MAG TPA: ester cyclase [Chitinophagaceae bacterium]|nr:ester cyclase [Chitinophagaceae bacterium]